ncbi:uncharacterized protein LOC126204746 [Schistocerca nitens]|uniref:uncharacterized protein LOC126204746 n=1 Tax=Schistocerca nitens TaxID=7011 RepID=UPI002118732B|nr:uncharacterized protein LOC126204746 [Schistocerca nitens]
MQVSEAKLTVTGAQGPGEMSDDLGELLGPVAAALRLLGLQAPSTSWSLTWRALLLLVVNVSVPAMAASKLWVAPAAKLEELAVEVFVCVTGVAMTVKVAAFLWQQERTKQLALLLADCRRRFVCSGGGPGDTRARYRRHIRRIVVYMQVMVVVPTTLWLLDPLVGAGSSARRLPMPMWVPPGLRSSPGHQILYAFQALAMITVVEASLYLDVCFVVLMLSVSAELHVLNDAIASIKAPAVLKDVERTTMSKMLCTLPIYMYETGLYCIFGQTIIDQVGAQENIDITPN